ncbi:PAS domain S-box protein, partial [Pararobbsia alpina]|uniref:PAS domain S-box protein n=1 Tax=Pararobbsia alpina TaxID=621374 RepID=UPI001C2E5989
MSPCCCRCIRDFLCRCRFLPEFFVCQAAVQLAGRCLRRSPHAGRSSDHVTRHHHTDQTGPPTRGYTARAGSAPRSHSRHRFRSCDVNDVITYWNHGAEELHGWNRTEAIGKVTHQLLKTRFLMPFDEIKEALLRTGR